MFGSWIQALKPLGTGFQMDKDFLEIIVPFRKISIGEIYLDGESKEGGGLYVRRN